MKRIISILCVCILIFIMSFSNIMSVVAISPIDSQKKSSLTVQYKMGDEYFAGIKIDTYRIADVSPDGTYTLCGAFKDYPVNIYGITSQSEWKSVTSTLNTFATADNLTPTCSAVANEYGTVSFEDILPGMYLTTSVRIEMDSKTILFESFLTAVPAPDIDGNHNYDVKVFPKCEVVTPTFDELEYKVVKHWKDSGNTEKRPQFIEIDIIRDGVVHTTQKLSNSNNWSYSWTAQDDGTVWNVKEKNVPSGYTVTVEKNGNTLIVTNTYDSAYEDPPKTGETTVLWPWILAMCLSGGMVVILSVWRKRVGV